MADSKSNISNMEQEDGKDLQELSTQIAEIEEHHNGEIHVHPRPTSDPTDPLNWSLGRKYVVLFVVTLYCTVGISSQSYISNFLPSVQQTFPNASASQINLLLTIITPVVAPTDIFVYYFATTTGRKPVFIVCLIIFVIANILGATSPSYTGFLISRILTAIATSPTDALQFTIVEDFTFQHQRGFFLGTLNSMGGLLQAVLTIVTGYMGVSLGYQWACVLYTCLGFVCLVCTWLWMPESSFHRHQADLLPQMTPKEYEEWRKSLGPNTELSVWKQLNPLSRIRRVEKQTFSQVTQQLLKVATHPTVWWLGCMQVVFLGGYSAMTVYFAQILTTAPWSWPAANVVLINLVYFPQAVIMTLMGWLSDRTLLGLARRRGGIMKTEDRLLTFPIPTISAFTGLLGFGALAQHYLNSPAGTSQPHWFSMVFIYLLINLSFGSGLEVTSIYLAGALDPQYHLAAMTISFAIRDLGSFGLSYGITPFASNVGFFASFGTYAALCVVFGSLAIPFYYYAGAIRKSFGASRAIE
ncbi:hypothetical protein BP6252_11330 [Coleophoma cylindrospora]|uniref:Major facilitator superfamily (MFS) profile domain-containing protein n=1 Tax=Coleophoma cylindrospora TaxID=1849047 RepID=A0A3D8QPQ0_9HELO|nr:hypothetical protein BP6252_11330 [Coleophoma cylindrospora]